MEAYLAAEKDGHLPLAIWRLVKPGDPRRAAQGSEIDFVRTEEGLRRRLADLKEKLGRDPKVFEEGDDPKNREGADVIVAKLYEHAEIAKAAKAVERFGVDPKAWTGPAADKGKAALGLWRIVSEGTDPVVVTGLRDLLNEVRKCGQRGVDVQRYKGLGEMNADQLKETTMDPERRTLLQIRLSDAAESDRLFGLLMGESVEPRKLFIEQHALDVTNIDI